jgi:phosphate-selective porin
LLHQNIKLTLEKTMKHPKYLILPFISPFILCLFNTTAKAQETTEANSVDTLSKTVNQIKEDLAKLKKIKLTGYVQPQWQYIDSAGAPSVAGGDFSNGNNKIQNRFMMRRGRIKFTYESGIATYSLNIDATENGVFMRETYAKINDPWTKSFSLLAGMHQVFFGFELNQSSGLRETPERARVNQTLFPTERDLGVFASYVAPKASALKGLRLDLAVMNGSPRVTREFDSYKDITARISYGKSVKNEKITFSVGASYYNGGYQQSVGTEYNFTTLANGEKGFEAKTDTSNFKKKALKEYIGADFQFSLDWSAGTTTIRGEYMFGSQPGLGNSSVSASAPLKWTDKLYHRNFDAAYFYLVQNIGQTKFQAVVKYDWYDPNVKISGRGIGRAGNNTNVGDVRFNTYGIGLTYRINNNMKIMGYYDIVQNEKTSLLQYGTDIKDNVTTIRMQYRF